MRGVTVEFTHARWTQIHGLTNALLQPAMTAANYGVISMMRTIAELSCWLLKSWHPWEEEEANQEDASGQYLDPPLTNTPVSNRSELVLTFLLMDGATKTLSDRIHPRRLITLLHWIELIGLPSMPSIVVRQIPTKTPVLKLMCPPRPVTPLRQQEVTCSGWADCNLSTVLEFMFVPRSVTPLRE